MDEIKINYGGQNQERGGIDDNNAPQPPLNIRGGEPASAKAMAGEGELREAEEGESKSGLFFEKALKIGIYILAFLVPLFFLPQTANVLELNKQFLIFIFSAVLLVLWLAKILTQRKLEIKKSLINIFVVLFVVTVFLSAFLAPNKFQGLLGFGGQISESFLVVVCLALVFFLAANSLNSGKDAGRLLIVLIGSAMILAIFGFLQLAGKFVLPWEFAKTAAFNLVGSANSFEIFLAAILVLTVTLFTDEDRPFSHLLGLGVVSAFLLFMIISLNFANVWKALIGVMALVVGFGIIKKGRSSQTRLIFAMVVLAMAMLISLTKINIASGWLQVPSEVSPSFKSTIDIDKGVISDKTIKAFFGSGPGTFGLDWELYRSELVNQTIFWNVRFSQGISKFFSLPATLGLAGAVFWAALLAFFFLYGAIKLITKSGPNWTMAFAFWCSWVFLATMQFLYSTNLTLEFMFWLAMAVSLVLLKDLKGRQEEQKTERVLLAFRRESPLASVFSFLLVIFLVLTISFFYLGFNYWRADAKFKAGLAAGINEGDLQKGYEGIAKAVQLNPYRDNYLNSLSQVALLRVNQELALPKSLERDTSAQQFIADAVNFGKAATDLNAQNPDNWIQRGTVYRAVLGYLAGAEDWMIDSFTQASKLQPKNPFASFELGRSYLLLSDFTLSQAGQDREKQAKAQDYLNKAEEQFGEATKIKPDYAPAHYQLALIYDRQGKLDEAINKMEITRSGFPSDIGVAFQLGLLYYKKQDFSSAKGEFERAISLDSNYSNARYFLGLIYDRQGKKDSAKEQFVKISELNPENEEVKRIILNLDAGLNALDSIAPPPPEDRSEPPVREKEQETR